jgi:hypothetical protein
LQAAAGHASNWSSDTGLTTIASHQDKVRKKLSADDEEARLDVRAELLVAKQLLADRRFELAFEAYGAQQRGPDLSVTFRANLRFNLEVTRLRGTGNVEIAKVANVIAGKLRQLPSDAPNALVIAGEALGLTAERVADAAHMLRSRSVGQLVAQYLRLGGVFVLDETPETPTGGFWGNPEARRPLPHELIAAVSQRLRA